jgi:hypothetical protein
MDLTSTSSYAAAAYSTTTRFVPLVPPPPPPPQFSLPVAPAVAPVALLPPPGPPGSAPGAPSAADVSGAGVTPAAGPAGGTIGPRFDLAALTTSPSPPPAAPTTPFATDAATPALQLPLPTPADLTTSAGAAGPPTLATLNRATALYTQTQQLGTPPSPASLPLSGSSATSPPATSAPVFNLPALIQPTLFPQQPSTLTPSVAASSQPSPIEGPIQGPTQEPSAGVVGINSLGGAAASSTSLPGFARGSFLNVLA